MGRTFLRSFMFLEVASQLTIGLDHGLEITDKKELRRDLEGTIVVT